VCVSELSCSIVSDSSETLWTAAHQTLLSMGFFRQEYWSELLSLCFYINLDIDLSFSLSIYIYVCVCMCVCVCVYELSFPGGTISSKEPVCQCRRHKRCRFDPWVGKIPWRATHSSILAWRIPWTEEPGVLPSIGSQRVRHD